MKRQRKVKHYLTEQDLYKIAKWLNRRYGTSELAAKLGCSKGTVSGSATRLRKMGVNIPDVMNNMTYLKNVVKGWKLEHPKLFATKEVKQHDHKTKTKSKQRTTLVKSTPGSLDSVGLSV